MSHHTQNYQPGCTNINSREALTRRESGYLATMFTLIGLCFLVLVEAPFYLYFFLLPSIWSATLGYLQSSKFFCIRLGFKGLQNASRSNNEPLPVMSTKARDSDRKQARVLLALSVVIAVSLTTAITYVAYLAMN